MDAATAESATDRPPKYALPAYRRRRPSERHTPTIYSVPLGLLSLLTCWLSIHVYYVFYPTLLRAYPELEEEFIPWEQPAWLTALGIVLALSTVLLLVAFVRGFLRDARGLQAIRKGYAVVYALVIFYWCVVVNLTGRIQAADIEVGGSPPDSVIVFYWRYDFLWMAVLIGVYMGVLHLFTWRRGIINFYTGADDEEDAVGDIVLENLRTHGDDPQFRKSTWGSVWSHLLVIIIIPWLLRLLGCIDPYRPPFGGGNPVVQKVMVVQPKKEKKKEYILRPDSAIYFHVPELDESKIMEQVMEETQVRYVADVNAAHGKLGQGQDPTPGWQDGFRDGIVRFIRMEFNGANWDDGMDSKTRADMNFLDKFRELSGGMKTATHSESHPIRLLKKYPRGQAPPFVFMTGSGGISVSNSDIKIMRKHLLEGGLLFADAGSGHFHSSFVNFTRKLFPGHELLRIADDDPILTLPFAFPNGVPPFWHHGGDHAMGIKIKNRWVVFYHPGDLNDAWKTGHSGIDPDLAEQAYYLGINVVYYSFINYMQVNRKYRK